MRACPLRLLALVALLSAAGVPLFAAESTARPDPGRLTFHSDPAARFDFGEPIAPRMQANLEHWLLRAPQANPGMLGMFHVRDRHPVPQLVPWAGEFVGKYLLSSVQALRLTPDPRLRQQVSNVVAELAAAQADDGYLGPFPRDKRLLGNWDLWGHYHAIQALVAWHELSGDSAALAVARRAGDLVCRTFLGTGRRVADAGDPEMNMAILTGMAMLHRVTGEPRYLAMAEEVEHDWERAGDYLRAGLDGREFYQSPRPRWESLHDLQGLVEMLRITGKPTYREAFVHHWRSIRRWDRRNTGGFSSGEQATGNPFANTAIETCCTVAWMALTVDYLRLTGDPLAADDLELATLNAGLGAQHPSGRWWTYNTPMDGVREASAHTIVFQSRAGTPELNCCSVNAPRVLGSLGDWAVVHAPDAVVLNWLAPLTVTTHAPNHSSLRLEITSAPDDLDTRIRVFPQTPGTEFTLRVRVPAWTDAPAVTVAATGPTSTGEPRPGTYVDVRRRWSPGDSLTLRLPRPLRVVPGAQEAAGKVSVYRGPILLAYDQRWNPFDPESVPPVDLAKLDQARVVPATSEPPSRFVPAPWSFVDLPTVGGGTVRLVDFANAGSLGTAYRSWLPASPAPHAPAVGNLPADAARLRPGPIEFRWRHRPGTAAPAPRPSFQLQFSVDPDFRTFASVPAASDGRNRQVVDVTALPPPVNSGSGVLYWRVAVGSPPTVVTPDGPPARLLLDPAGPAQTLPPEPKLGPAGEWILHSLLGETPPAYGRIESAAGADRGPEGTIVRGNDQRLVYALDAWPEEEFTVAVRVKLDELPRGRIGQVFSAWTAGGDDPLRLVVDGGKLFARIEGGGGFGTPGFSLETGRWYAVAAVRKAGRLTLLVDGRAVGSTDVPQQVITQSRACALGGNPRYGGDEHLAATFAQFGVWGRGLTSEELAAHFAPKRP